MKVREAFLLVPLLLAACDNISSDKASAAKPEDNMQHAAKLQALIRQVKSNLVFVEGGDFLMGDFGREYGPEKMQYDANKDSKPLHKVTLSSYSTSKSKSEISFPLI